MKPWMRVAGVGVFASACLLVGCGGGSSPTASLPAPPTTTTPTTPATSTPTTPETSTPTAPATSTPTTPATSTPTTPATSTPTAPATSVPNLPAIVYGSPTAYEFATVVDNTGLSASQYTSAPTTDYVPQSPEWVTFMRLNHDRVRCGFGGLNSNRLLDRAAQGHAWYLTYNNRLSDGHNELAADLPYFAGNEPKDRVLAAGYNYRWTGEELVTFSDYQNRSLGEQALSSIKSLMMAPYHMTGLFGGFREVGIHATNSATVGAKTGGLAATNLVLGIPMTTPTTLVQQRRTGEVVTYPCEGIDDTATALFNEMPNPFPGRDLSKDPVGQPVLVQANEGSTVNISQASYREKTTGVTLPLSILAGQVDASLPKFNSHQVFVVPMQALKGNTEYQVNLVGTVTTVVNNQQSVQPFVRDFSFKTGAQNDF